MPDPQKSSQSSQSAPASEAKAPAKDDAPKAAKGDLAPAGESTDPEVHKLLADRQTAQTNLDAVTPSDADKDAAELYRKQVEAIDEQLADLGVSSK
jgi:hypothetical protein